MSRAMLLSALLLSTAAAWPQYGLEFGEGPRPFHYVFSEDLRPDPRDRDFGGLYREAGPVAGPSGPVMHGRELPAETVAWLRELGPDDVAILCVIHGPEGLTFPGFPIEELADLVNACEAGFLMVVLDLPAQYELPTLDEILHERRRAELFQRHTIVLAAKPWGVRHWVTAPSSEEFPMSLLEHPNWAVEEYSQGLPLFSAYLYQALQGHADRDVDRQVTAKEAFEYAFWCTWIDCEAPGATYTQTVRQTPSVRPGPGWDTAALTTGRFVGEPDPLSIVRARYAARDFMPPLGPPGPTGSFGPPGPAALPAGPWPQAPGNVAPWTWGNIAAIEERLAATEARLADVRILAEDPPARLDVPRWRQGRPVLLGGATPGPAGWPGPLGTDGEMISLTELLEESATDEQLAAARANEQALFALGRAVREVEFAVERLAVVCLDYYAVEAVSISPQFIAPTQWPEGLAAPFAVRGPMGPPGPAGGAGELVEPERTEPLWAEATARRLQELSARAREVAAQARATTLRFNRATDGWLGLER